MAPSHPEESAAAGGTLRTSAVGFLVVYCEGCDGDVLSARELDEAGDLVDVCVHCERLVDRNHPSTRLLGADDLAAMGYVVEGRESVEERRGSRGCRDGSCGISQPDS